MYNLNMGTTTHIDNRDINMTVVTLIDGSKHQVSISWCLDLIRNAFENAGGQDNDE